MKNFNLIISALLTVTCFAEAQTQKAKPAYQPKAGPKIYSQSKSSAAKNQIQQALTQFKAGNYAGAAVTLHGLSRRADLINERPQLKIFLGDALMELNLNQTAAFQFVDVIRSGSGQYTRQALEKLLVVTDRLGDETLLNYAIQRIDVSSIPDKNRDMLFFRMGEIKQSSGQYAEAIQLFQKVGPQSRYYPNALYALGLAQAEANQPDLALATFNKFLGTRSSAKVTDVNKVAAQMAIARTLYQKKDFDKAIEAYSQIPRDHFMWHDALFEQSWAMLRGTRFRSALSNFQSLHSSYYDDYYIPESLLLRSIVYLFICKYDEMEKVLGLYEKQYGPVLSQVTQFLNSKKLAEDYYNEVEKAYIMRRSEDSSKKTILPYKVANKINSEGNVRRSLNYIKAVVAEKRSIEENAQLRKTPLGIYAMKLLNARLKSAKAATGDMVKAHLENIETELKDLQEQASLIRYEMINGQKETIRKRIVGKDLSEIQVDSKQDRSFYIQNGYEYYPFMGEYWLDEIGNYHYLGQQSCE